MRFNILLLCFMFFSGFSAALSQDKRPTKSEEDDVIRVDTELVDVPVVVTDRVGKPLINLKQSNFTVFEDGKPQEVSDFSATLAPFEIALLLDTSGSTRDDLQLIKRSAQNFINALRPGDRVSLIAFRTDIKDKRAQAVSEILSPLTADRDVLRSSLERTSTSNGTPYYDGIIKIVETVFRGEPAPEFRGRRAVVAVTDGDDSTSVSDFDEMRELLEKAGLLTYFIQVNTREFFEQNLLGDCQSSVHFSSAQIRRYYRRFYPNANIEKVSNFCQLGDFERLAVSKKLYELADVEMMALAKASGGKVFPVGDLSEARNAFKSVADEIGTKYSLGYYSANAKRDGTYRKITVQLKGLPAGTLIRAREGYTAPAR